MFSFNLPDLPAAMHAEALRLAAGFLNDMATLVESSEGAAPGEEPAVLPFAKTPPVMPPGVPSFAVAEPTTTAPTSATLAPPPGTAGQPPALPPMTGATAPAGAAPALVPGVELDSRGFPWDGRIHSESKGRIGDGSWRKKKNLDAALLAQVEAEHVAARNAGVPPAAPPVAPAPASGSPTDFGSLMVYNGARVNAGKLTAEEVAGIAVGLGLASVGLIATRPDLIPAIVAQVDAIVAARGGM